MGSGFGGALVAFSAAIAARLILANARRRLLDEDGRGRRRLITVVNNEQ